MVSGAMPMPVSRTSKLSSARPFCRASGNTSTDHLALVRELDGVADEVGENLAQAGRVAEHASGTPGSTLTMSSSPFAAACVAIGHADVFDASRTCSGARSTSSLPASIFEKSSTSLMMPRRAVGAGADGLGELALRRLQRRVEQQLGHADDAVHRRADLVAHVREEVGLRADRGRFGILGGDARLFRFTLLRDVLQGAGQPRDRSVARFRHAHDSHPQMLAGAGDEGNREVVRRAVLERFTHRALHHRARVRRVEAERIGEGGRDRRIELGDPIRLVGPDGHHRGEIELPATDARHGGNGIEQMAPAPHLSFSGFTAQERRLERGFRMLALTRFRLCSQMPALRALGTRSPYTTRTPRTSAAIPAYTHARFK